MTRARGALVALGATIERVAPAKLIAAAVPFALSLACSAPLMKLPAGPGAPAPDAAELVTTATRACRAVNTLTAEIAVSGSAGGRKLRGRLSTGLEAPASARLEAVAPFGQPYFILVARDHDATLLLPRDDRILQHAEPDAVLEAIAGVPLGTADLRAVLTGCGATSAGLSRAERRGDDWLVAPDGDGRELYLRRTGASGVWQLVASAGRDWRAQYQEFRDDLPRTIRVTSTAAKGPAFDLQLVLSQVDVNVPLGPDVFSVRIPSSAQPITIDDLKKNGPIGTRERPDAR
jgi:hypothetical protein